MRLKQSGLGICAVAVVCLLSWAYSGSRVTTRALAFEHSHANFWHKDYANDPTFIHYREMEDQAFAQEQLIEMNRKTRQSESLLPSYPLGSLPPILPACGHGELQPHEISVQRQDPDGTMINTRWIFDADITREGCSMKVHVHLVRVPQMMDTSSENIVRPAS